MQEFFRAVSMLFQPFTMPLIGAYAMFQLGATRLEYLTVEFELATYYFLALLTMLVPILNFVILRKYGIVSDLNVSNQKERLPVFLFTLFYFGLCYYFMRSTFRVLDSIIPGEYYAFMFGSLIAIVFAFVVNFWWKISLHAMCVGGVLGGVFCSSLTLFGVNLNSAVQVNTILILITGITCSARLVMNKHTPAQVYAGLFSGFAILFFSVKYHIFL